MWLGGDGEGAADFGAGDFQSLMVVGADRWQHPDGEGGPLGVGAYARNTVRRGGGCSGGLEAVLEPGTHVCGNPWQVVGANENAETAPAQARLVDADCAEGPGS